LQRCYKINASAVAGENESIAMPVISVDPAEAEDVKPDLTTRVSTYMDGVKYTAEIEVWRGAGPTPDEYLLMCEFGYFWLSFPKGLNRREVRSMAIQTLRGLVAECRENFVGWSQRVPRSEWEPA
jgi:hypothetical protein